MEKLDPLFVQSELIRKNIRLFTTLEFSRLFGASPTKTKYFLETYVARGLFTRLRQGLYIIKNERPSEEEIANALYQPSYISFEYALARYNIIPEMVYAVTSATTKPTRSFSVAEKSFEYLTIKKHAYAGYVPIREEGRQTILLAEPEKALVDYLYFVSLGRKTNNDRLNIGKLDREKVEAYADLYQRQGLRDLITTLW